LGGYSRGDHQIATRSDSLPSKGRFLTHEIAFPKDETPDVIDETLKQPEMEKMLRATYGPDVINLITMRENEPILTCPKCGRFTETQARSHRGEGGNSAFP
jgi:hypothetical protein